MNESDLELLACVKHRAKDSEMLNRIISAAIDRFNMKFEEIRSHACAMETVAALAMNADLKGNEGYVADQLESFKHLNACKWDSQIEKLRKKSTSY